MGIQYSKRTKGKDGWLNFSYSKRNGLGASATVKVGGLTYNFGGRRANRTTVDLGDGLKYVSYGPSKAKKNSPKQPITSAEGGPMKKGDWLIIAQFIYAAALINTMFSEPWPWKILAAVLSAVWIYRSFFRTTTKQE